MEGEPKASVIKFEEHATLFACTASQANQIYLAVNNAFLCKIILLKFRIIGEKFISPSTITTKHNERCSRVKAIRPFKANFKALRLNKCSVNRCIRDDFSYPVIRVRMDKGYSVDFYYIHDLIISGPAFANLLFGISYTDGTNLVLPCLVT